MAIDVEVNFLLTGKKRSRGPSGDTKAAEAKKAKKQRAQGGGSTTSKSPVQRPLTIQPLASAPPVDSGKGPATGASPTPALKQAKLKF